MSLNILIVDDIPDDRETMQRLLAKIPEVTAPVLEAVDEATCHAKLEDNTPIDCFLLDYSLPGRDGLKVLQKLLQRDPMATVVMVTGQGDEVIAVKALKAGAQDYLVKDALSVASLTRAISNAMERPRLRRKIRDQKESLQTFAQVIVHDLRAPLRAISDAIGMLSEDLPEAIATGNAEMLEFINAGAQRMDALILALKSYTDVDCAPPTFDKIDLNEKITHVCLNLAAVIKEKRAKVTCQNTLSSVWGSPPLIEQLLQNLIGNGIKYNRSDVPVIRISTTEIADSCVIKVSDNDIGIGPDYLQLIFEPFKRLHGQGDFEGTGLGLATCKQIAERHEGTLTCESKPGSGSTFTIVLPSGCLSSGQATSCLSKLT